MATSKRSLKERVEILESRVDQLQRALAATTARRTRDWRRTIGVFTGDEGMLKILQDAMKLREEDRKNI